MKRFWAGYLSLFLIVGFLVVTTPCDCRNASAFLAKAPTNAEAQCPICAKHKTCAFQPSMDQRTVLNPSSGFYSPAVLVLQNAPDRGLVLTYSVAVPEIYLSPPHSPPLNLRI
jgi:hypothetical protein